jgi:hypothetical protein
MLVDDMMPFRLVWCEWAHFLAFAPNFHYPPNTWANGRIPGVRWSPVPTESRVWISGGHLNFAEKVGYRVSGVSRVQDLRPAGFKPHSYETWEWPAFFVPDQNHISVKFSALSVQFPCQTRADHRSVWTQHWLNSTKPPAQQLLYKTSLSHRNALLVSIQPWR